MIASVESMLSLSFRDFSMLGGHGETHKLDMELTRILRVSIIIHDEEPR